jgi:hypothetical protein
MPDHDQQLFRRWSHSFEEDHGDVRVYRPVEFDFPRARGRGGIEFRDDGSYVDWATGPGDARQPRPGSWRREGAGRLRITTATGEQRTVTVLRVTPDRLELRAGSQP